MDIKKYLQEKKEAVNLALKGYLAQEGEFPTSLHKAIRYSLFDGGKRIRPILTIAAFEAVGGKGDEVLPFACALEMIHTYSLIHDDLPSIDNDDYRRGKPTCHKMFGEAISILAGDALLTEAFRLMTDCSITRNSYNDGWMILKVVNEIGQAAGILGMVGGQALDVESEGKKVDLPLLQYIHAHKTGALILASVRAGVMLGAGDRKTLRAFTQYGERIGLAFQIKDDILNVEGKADLLGKSIGSDLTKKKASYPFIIGLEESKRRIKELGELAVDALIPFGPTADPLREIVWFIISREY